MRKQFKDAGRVSPAIHGPDRKADGPALPALPAQPALLQRRYRLLRAQDHSGRQLLYVYDQTLGRSLLCWRGAVASALLNTTHVRKLLGTATTARCDKATVRRLMLDAARYAADVRADARCAQESER